MGRTARYLDPVPYRPARAELQLEAETVVLVMPDSRMRRHSLHGVTATICDGFVAEPSARGSSPLIDVYAVRPQQAPRRVLRRFVRMLVLERGSERIAVVITPPDQGAVAPNVVSIEEAPQEAAILDVRAWEALAEWLVTGGRLAACSISELARLACIATPQFAVLIGEVAAQRALEYVWGAHGPLRGGFELESVLQPFADAAKHSARANDALVSALAHAAGQRRRRRFR